MQTIIGRGRLYKKFEDHCYKQYCTI